jgi:hypothetical protein
MYLAIKFRNPTVIDAIQHAFEQIKFRTGVNAEIPRFAGLPAQSAFIDIIQTQINEESALPGLLLEFLASLRASAEPAARFSLPWVTANDKFDPPADAEVAPLFRFPSMELIKNLGPNSGSEVLLDGNRIHLTDDAIRVLDKIMEVSF